MGHLTTAEIHFRGHLSKERNISKLKLFSEFVLVETFAPAELLRTFPCLGQYNRSQHKTDVEDEAGIGSGEVHFSSISNEISKYLNHIYHSEISCVRSKQ